MRAVAAAVLIAAGLLAPLAVAQDEGTPPREGAPTLDGTVVRYFAPETGGAARPQFLTQRVASFQARMEAKAEDIASVGTQDRHVRAGIERLVVEGVLSSLPLERAPDARELANLVATFRAGLSERVGDEKAIDTAAAAEGLAPEEVDAIFARRARAALYADRSLSPLLFPTEEELREVFRTAPHPFRGRRFDEIRPRLAAWYIDERMRVVEGAFLQTARSRIRIVNVRR